MGTFTDNILLKAKNAAEEILSKANADAVKIGSESMQKANEKRKELQASCLKEAEQLILSIKESALKAGETKANELKQEVVSEVVEKVVEQLSNVSVEEKVCFYKKLLNDIRDNAPISVASKDMDVVAKAAEALNKKIQPVVSETVKEGFTVEEKGTLKEYSIRTLASKVLEAEKDNIEKILFPAK